MDVSQFLGELLSKYGPFVAVLFYITIVEIQRHKRHSDVETAGDQVDVDMKRTVSDLAAQSLEIQRKSDRAEERAIRAEERIRVMEERADKQREDYEKKIASLIIEMARLEAENQVLRSEIATLRSQIESKVQSNGS